MTPTTDKITHQLAPRLAPLDLLTTMRRRNTALSCKNRWAQQGSNLRPLACKARTYRRWTSLDVARCGSCQPRLWLDVAWCGLMPVDVGSPFGSPHFVSAANLQ